MTNISHNLNPPSTGDTRPGSEDALLATARENIEAGDNAGREFYRKAADALVTTWKTHKTPQRKMAEAVGRFSVLGRSAFTVASGGLPSRRSVPPRQRE